MIIFQLLLSAFFLIVIAKLLARFKAHEISGLQATIWLIFWIIACVIVFLPNSTAKVAKIFHIGRGVDLVIYVGLAIIFYSIFRISVKIEKQKKEITALARKIVLNDVKDNE
ncbi:MAG: DUF2304 family protein [bacterium]